ncbi:isochorismate synthase [Synechococcales cyanobacterium C]|uniref:isochorismate synthase n=1 Tax=Petrachloros mirabilis ULC683 TaxID=2781853 RepID=A0A8K2A0Z6_9CYAN|nr:isochorismate synthase [Petrachloros mirabilis]NCJ07613.1 isochorismate synthase [Petrachloros mirabilis ULC683]
MPVIPSPAHSFQDCQSLHDFFVACQASVLESEPVFWVSVTLRLPSVDPLAVLDALQLPQQPSFYWEQPEEDTAIAALDSVALLQVDGEQRFKQAQWFMERTLQHTITAGDTNLPFGGPHFFCSFTFFNETSTVLPPYFPAATVFLPRWQVTRHGNQSLLVANVRLEAHLRPEHLTQEIWQQWQRIKRLTPYVATPWNRSALQLECPLIQETDWFIQAVQSTLGAIAAGDLQKLVLAHALDVPTTTAIPVSHALNALRTRYQNCYVFAVSNGEGQTFLGASPERLLKVTHRQLITDVLAGSAPRGATLLEDASLGNQLLSSAKDVHEHQVVLEFIRTCLRQLHLDPQQASFPHLLQLSNIQHLRTLITATLPPSLHILEILAALHPTPAVAGMPRTLAQDLLRRYETFERHLYAAPLGWVNTQGNGEFAVGIRSALINSTMTRLYAGAGIVAGSDPKRELAEIQLKLHTLLDALL